MRAARSRTILSSYFKPHHRDTHTIGLQNMSNKTCYIEVRAHHMSDQSNQNLAKAKQSLVAVQESSTGVDTPSKKLYEHPLAWESFEPAAKLAFSVWVGQPE